LVSPSKIFWPIVGPVSVNVVNVHLILGLSVEGYGNQAMNKCCLSSNPSHPVFVAAGIAKGTSRFPRAIIDKVNASVRVTGNGVSVDLDCL
jgi:hypothetical protein